MEFEDPIEFTSNVKPINYEHACPPKRTYIPIKDDLNVGDIVKLYGWGFDYDGDGQSPDILQSGVLEITQINNDNIIAGHSDDTSVLTFGTPCSGDSRGPLVKEINGEHFLIGILSTGNGAGNRCPTGSYGEWERVSYYSSFIDYHLNNQCRPQLVELNDVCSNILVNAELHNIGYANANWTSSSNVQIVTRSNSGARIRAINDSNSATGWVTATLNNGIELTEEFNVGKPSKVGLKIQTTGNGIYVFSKTWQEIYLTGGSNYDDVEWKVLDAQTRKIGNGRSLLIYPTTTGNTLKISVRLENNCGYSEWMEHTFTIYIRTHDGGISIMH